MTVLHDTALYRQLREHVGHPIVCVNDGNRESYALECTFCHVTLVDVQPEGETGPERAELAQPRVHARMHSDDHTIALERVDVTDYFAQVNDDDLRKLIDCNFGGDDPSDQVAYTMDGRDEEVALLMRYTEHTDTGFEVYVDEDEARAWIKVHRPHIYRDEHAR